MKTISNTFDYLSSVFMNLAICSAGLFYCLDLYSARSHQAILASRFGVGFFVTSYALSYLSDATKPSDDDEINPRGKFTADI